MNRHRPHLIVVPEDDAIRQVAIGFEKSVDRGQQFQVRREVGGWLAVLAAFLKDLVPHMNLYNGAHVVLAIDFDKDLEARRCRFDNEIPPQLRDRVYVLGSRREVENVRDFGSYEVIGEKMAQACRNGAEAFWAHPDLENNLTEARRLHSAVQKLLFD